MLFYIMLSWLACLFVVAHWNYFTWNLLRYKFLRQLFHLGTQITSKRQLGFWVAPRICVSLAQTLNQSVASFLPLDVEMSSQTEVGASAVAAYTRRSFHLSLSGSLSMILASLSLVCLTWCLRLWFQKSTKKMTETLISYIRHLNHQSRARVN